MDSEDVFFQKMDALFNELIAGQEKKVWESGSRIVPYLTMDDLLQPNDFPELEYNPFFRYEEGVLSGLLTAYAALNARRHELNC